MLWQAQIGREGRRRVPGQPGEQVIGRSAGRQRAGPAPGHIGLEDLARRDPAHHLGYRRLIGRPRRGAHGPGQNLGFRAIFHCRRPKGVEQRLGPGLRLRHILATADGQHHGPLPKGADVIGGAVDRLVVSVRVVT